jgi:hypothetical protein
MTIIHTVGYNADSAWCSCGWTGPSRGSSYADQETAALAAFSHAEKEN